MKVVHVLNLANNAYHIVKALRRNGFDSDLIISSADFGMGLPMWEELELQEDPYNINFRELIEKFDIPEWMKIWWNDELSSKPFMVPDLFRLTKEYDLLHLHPPSPLYLQFSGKAYIVHEAGWIRRLATLNTSKEKLGRRSYAHAECIVMTNPDTYSLLNRLEYKREIFIPFVVDPDKYKPVETEKHEELLFFHPTRQIWDVKGNYYLIQAFAQFIKKGWKAKLRMVDWGFEEDVARTKKLLTRLRLDPYIEWVSPYSKPQLIKVYSECDAVFDQFLLGSGGTICYEAMACKAPVVIYLNHWNEKCFGEMPPVVNVQTVDEIYNAMTFLTDPNFRRKVGERERSFVLRHNHPNTIALKLIKLYKEVYL